MMSNHSVQLYDVAAKCGTYPIHYNDTRRFVTFKILSLHITRSRLKLVRRSSVLYIATS